MKHTACQNEITDQVKIIILGMALYLMPKNIFFNLCSKLYPAFDKNVWEDRVIYMKKTFYRYFIMILLFVSFVTIIQYGFPPHFEQEHWLRRIAIIIALGASLGRGGWYLQTDTGRSIVERIDKGMYIISQLGATVFLLLAMTVE